MIRLNINVPPHAVGDVLSPEQVAALGDTFVQELIAAEQATRLAEDASTDPVDLVLGEVFELEDQIDAALGRRARILVLQEGLDDDGRDRVSMALESASRIRPELFGQAELVSPSELESAKHENRRLIGLATERAEEIAGLKADLSQAQVVLEERSDRIADLERNASADALQIERLKADLAAASSSTDTPPPPAEASGDAGEVSASPADPAAPAPVKPAAKSGGTAKAKAGS